MITRRLTLAALAASAISLAAPDAWAHDDQIANIAGTYNARGMNANGSTYSGTVQIIQQGAAVDMYWSIAGQSYSGNGVLQGRVRTVNWGAATPVVYVLMGRELHGTWDGGTALEKLMPR